MQKRISSWIILLFNLHYLHLIPPAVVDITGDTACDYKVYYIIWLPIFMRELFVLYLALLFKQLSQPQAFQAG